MRISSRSVKSPTRSAQSPSRSQRVRDGFPRAHVMRARVQGGDARSTGGGVRVTIESVQARRHKPPAQGEGEGGSEKRRGERRELRACPIMVSCPEAWGSARPSTASGRTPDPGTCWLLRHQHIAGRQLRWPLELSTLHFELQAGGPAASSNLEMKGKCWQAIRHRRRLHLVPWLRTRTNREPESFPLRCTWLIGPCRPAFSGSRQPIHGGSRD